MNEEFDDAPHIWKPIKPLPEDAGKWVDETYERSSREWHEIRGKMKAGSPEERFIQKWCEERNRAHAIETGQIEALYTLGHGITETLIAEGFQSVVGAYAIEKDMDGEVLKGLLEDQETAYNMIWQDIANGIPLSQSMIKKWHQLLTRHQATVTGLTPDGRRVQVEFREKGMWKIIENNPRRADGNVHQYCPPEQVQSEMDNLFEMYEKDVKDRYPAHVEAAWLHHRFVRTHPFRDGNGRVSRQLVGWVYAKRHLPPPVITNRDRGSYISALEMADEGRLKRFADYLLRNSQLQLYDAIDLGMDTLEGRFRRRNGNGGVTLRDKYHPPEAPYDGGFYS